MTVERVDLAGAQASAARGELAAWVQAYLRSGAWANLPLAEGLLRQRRWWLGPVRVSLDGLIRVVGDEPGMAYPIPSAWWQEKVGRLADGMHDVATLPPLIVEARPEGLSVRDGNHRLAAMIRKGWESGWIVIWCNTEADYLVLAQRFAPSHVQPPD